MIQSSMPLNRSISNTTPFILIIILSIIGSHKYTIMCIHIAFIFNYLFIHPPDQNFRPPRSGSFSAFFPDGSPVHRIGFVGQVDNHVAATYCGGFREVSKGI